MFRAVALAMMLSLVAGCGDSPAPTTITTTVATGPVISLTEFRFAPQTITVDGPGMVSLTVQNDGSTQHDWVLLAQPISAESELADAAILASVTVNAGVRQTFTFEAPAPGEYQVICSIAGHFDSGMEGRLVVE